MLLTAADPVGFCRPQFQGVPRGVSFFSGKFSEG